MESGRRACGAVPSNDGITDYPINIRGNGVDCKTARLIARLVTLDGFTQTPLNFECPDALKNSDLEKHCSKGSLSVTWDVKIQ